MPSKVDVLFVTPPSRAQVYQELSQSLAAIEPPVWSGLIATYIQAQGFSVEILDSEALGLTVEETAKQIVERHASLTVFMIYGQQPSASTQCMPAGRQVCSLLNEAGTFPTLVIGTHPSALPEQTLREEPYRFVCEGEGPRTVLGLLHALRSRSLTLHNVPGLWYWDNGKIQHNPSAEKIDNLDLELPGKHGNYCQCLGIEPIIGTVLMILRVAWDMPRFKPVWGVPINVHFVVLMLRLAPLVYGIGVANASFDKLMNWCNGMELPISKFPTKCSC